MVSGIDLLLTDLAESIPHVLVSAMRAREANVVRGLQAIANTIWHVTNPAVRLVELIVDAKREGERFVYRGLMEEVINSTRGREIIEDFVDWGLIEEGVDDDGDFIYVVPSFWDWFIDSHDSDAPDLGLEALGRLLGLCSLARHADRRTVGLKNYIPVKSVTVRASRGGGAIPKDEAKGLFCRYAGYDADRRWLDLIRGQMQRVPRLRFFADAAAEPLIVNPDAIVALERVIARTNELLIGRSI